MNVHDVLRRVERIELLDRPAGAAADISGRLVGRRGLARALRGSWLGHPIHPILVTVPIGSWTAAAVFDVLFHDVTTARRLVAVGLAATGPTALAGWADYPLLDKRQQRVGLVHAASNIAGATLLSLAYRAYRKERPRAGRTYLLLGLVAIGVGGALGGHLSYAQGAGVFRWQPARASGLRAAIEHQRAA